MRLLTHTPCQPHSWVPSHTVLSRKPHSHKLPSQGFFVLFSNSYSPFFPIKCCQCANTEAARGVPLGRETHTTEPGDLGSRAVVPSNREAGPIRVISTTWKQTPTPPFFKPLLWDNIPMKCPAQSVQCSVEHIFQNCRTFCVVV